MVELKLKPVYFLIRARNAFEFFDRCINSIFSQKNKNYVIIYIDDASRLQLSQKKYIRRKLRHHIVQFNHKRKYAVRNAYEAIHRYVPDDVIIISLDGDDWLSRDDVIDIILATYSRTCCKLTYGNCRYFNPRGYNHEKVATDVHPFANTRFSEKTEASQSFRLEHFRPLHLKTWNAKLFKAIPKNQFLFPNGSWLRFCEDQAIYYPMLEAHQGTYEVIDVPLMAYNISHLNSDDSLYKMEKIVDEVAIRRLSVKFQKLFKIRNELNDLHTPIFVYYSPWARGLLGGIYLIYQFILLMCNSTRKIYLGNQQRYLERILIVGAELKSNIFIVRSFDAGFSLSQCTQPVLLDAVWLTTKPTSLQIENTMWSLTFSRDISKRCHDYLMSNGISLKKYGLIYA